jgi:drug/metabolite transporter (DMT)-like permease
MPSKLKIHSALLAVGLLYGANYTIAKILTPHFIGPYGVILLRVFIGGLLFWGLGLFSKSERIAYKRDYLKLAGLSLLGVAINQLTFFKGLSITTPIMASVLMTSSPIIVLIAAYLILKEKVSKVKVFGIALGATGAILLIGIDGFEFTSTTFLGNFLIVVNAASFSIYLVLVKPLLIRYRPFTIIKWIFFFGFFFVFPFGIGELLVVDWQMMPQEAWLSLSYVIIGATFLVYLLNNWALQFVSPSLVGYYIYVQPVFSTLIAISFRGDNVRIDELLYSILIFVGVYFVSIRKSRSKVELN